MALVLSGSIDISGSMTATTILISSPGAAGMVSSSAQITELAPLMAYTASLKGAAIVSSSTQVQNYDIFALNSNLYNSTGSIKGEIAGIEAYTASLKGAAIVSSSQQITNYYKFAETASANTFYGTQTISGSLIIGNANTLNIYRTDNTRALQLYTTNDECVINSWEASSEPLHIRSMGSGGRIQFFTSGSEKMRLTPDGYQRMATGTKGIQFNGDTAADNALNDYEEGTFTPTTASDATGALGGKTGEYTKIGNVVHFRMACEITTNFTSNAIGGLPFTIGGSGSPSSVQGGMIVFNASATNIIGRMDTAVTTISFLSDSIVSSTLAPTTTMGILRMSGTYRTS